MLVLSILQLMIRNFINSSFSQFNAASPIHQRFLTPLALILLIWFIPSKPLDLRIPF